MYILLVFSMHLFACKAFYEDTGTDRSINTGTGTCTDTDTSTNTITRYT